MTYIIRDLRSEGSGIMPDDFLNPVIKWASRVVVSFRLTLSSYYFYWFFPTILRLLELALLPLLINSKPIFSGGWSQTSSKYCPYSRATTALLEPLSMLIFNPLF